MNDGQPNVSCCPRRLSATTLKDRSRTSVDADPTCCLPFCPFILRHDEAQTSTAMPLANSICNFIFIDLSGGARDSTDGQTLSRSFRPLLTLPCPGFKCLP